MTFGTYLKLRHEQEIGLQPLCPTSPSMHMSTLEQPTSGWNQNFPHWAFLALQCDKEASETLKPVQGYSGKWRSTFPSIRTPCYRITCTRRQRRNSQRSQSCALVSAPIGGRCICSSQPITPIAPGCKIGGAFSAHHTIGNLMIACNESVKDFIFSSNVSPEFIWTKFGTDL